MMADSARDDLCGCLRRIATLLEQGEPEAAAAVVTEMNEVLSHAPPEMPTAEIDEARALLDRCERLERDARQNVLVLLQGLAATRKSSIYRRFGHDP